MIFYLLLIVILCIYKAKVSQDKIYTDEYLSRETTMSIKGVFMLLIIASHYKQYVELNGIYDKSYLNISSWLSQTIVTVFLFYSGYGIVESIKAKGQKYVRLMPIKRIFITCINFWMAILVFLGMNFLIGRKYDIKTILLSFTGWKSVGNSTWYIVAIICMYASTWIAFTLFRSRHFGAICFVAILSVVYMFVMRKYRPDQGWWYNTILCYVTGMWWSFYRGKIKELFDKYSWLYPTTLVTMVIGTLAARPYTYHLWIYQIWAVLFTGVVILITMKITIRNEILSWIGQHTFELYIFQRLPMILLDYYGLSSRPYIYGIIVFVLIFPVAWALGKVLHIIDTKILSVFMKNFRDVMNGNGFYGGNNEASNHLRNI